MSTTWRYATEDATAIADSAFQLATGLGGIERARAVRDAWPRADGDAWSAMAEMGWLGMMVPEKQGGLGLAMSDVAVLLENLGRVLVPEPIAQGVAAAGLLAAMDGGGNRSLLADLMAGRRVILPAADVPHMGEASRRTVWVPDATANSTLLIPDRADSFVVKAIACEAAGVTVEPHACVDGSSLTEVGIDHAAWAAAPAAGTGEAAQAAFARALDLLLIGYSAGMVGLMHEALGMTLSFMALRKQFGQPIGAFQALQHRAATCHVAIASSRALVHEACKSDGSPSLLRRAAGMTKAHVSDAALRVTKECVQFHGAIGFTDEHAIGLYLRRAMTLASRQGNSRVHRSRLAE